MTRFFWILCIGAGLTACSSVNQISVSSNRIAVNESFNEANKLDSLISPYRDSVDLEMKVVIARAEVNFEKGRPNGALNNWAANAILNNQVNDVSENEPTFCLLNTGGLRNSINAGDVTIGDIFKLMPFDNTIVWVKMPMESLHLIGEYLKKSGGEPIAGAKFMDDTIVFNRFIESDYFWVITSDYLLEGGDHMDFFQQRLEEVYTLKLMRDAMIEEAKKEKVLQFNDEVRISF